MGSAIFNVLPTTMCDTDKVVRTPIDYLANALMELGLAPGDEMTGTYGGTVNHVVHPHPVTWT